MPALVVLGMWIVLQLFGVGSIGTTSSTTETGGVAIPAMLAASSPVLC
jgi:hypothetical protein